MAPTINYCKKRSAQLCSAHYTEAITRYHKLIDTWYCQSKIMGQFMYCMYCWGERTHPRRGNLKQWEIKSVALFIVELCLAGGIWCTAQYKSNFIMMLLHGKIATCYTMPTVLLLLYNLSKLWKSVWPQKVRVKKMWNPRRNGCDSRLMAKF